MTAPCFPAFFAAAPSIRVVDPLADFLGAAQGGVIDYRYEDAVRLAGHSCPTVAGAFLATRAGLRALYGEALPCRGEIGVSLHETRDAGVAGVIAAVAGLVTGATEDGGFRGIGGRFCRRNTLRFGQALAAGEIAFARLDTGASVEVELNIGGVAGDARIGVLLPLCASGEASDEEHALFRELWQDRVRRLLLEHADDGETICVHAMKIGQ